MLAIPFPIIDPVALELGPLVIRWYSLAYVCGILLGWRYMLQLARRPPQLISAPEIDDFILWATLGIILGGRLGYVLFYRPGYFLDNPGEILMLWRGGMSFHGGIAGVCVAIWLFARKRGVPWLAFADLVCAAAPIGLFFGRIANFINGELYGRISDVPWAMVFPRGGPLARHPSQFYEAALEGLVLFTLLAIIIPRTRALEKPGLVSGIFLMGYAICRFGVEFVREPDAHFQNLMAGATMGQLLSLPLALAGIYLFHYATRKS